MAARSKQVATTQTLALGGAWNGVKVFSATMVANRERLGEEVTAWLAAHPECAVADLVVTQSSDAAFHCIVIALFYREGLSARDPRSR